MRRILNVKARAKGFTIVELLVVIVVIGIIAGIVYVSYSNVQKQARETTVKSDLQGAAGELELKNWQVGGFPADLATAGLKASPKTTYQYRYTSSNNSYCLTATNIDVSYYLTSDNASPKQGGCPGHGVNGVEAATNLVLNPNVNDNIVGYTAANSASVAYVATSVLGGSHAGQVTMNNGGITDSGLTLSHLGNLSGMVANTTYTLSLDVQSATARTLRMSVQGSGATQANTSTSFAAAQIRRMSITFTTNDWSTGSAVAVYLLRSDTLSGNLIFKNVALFSGTESTYHDGNSTNWIWNGAPNSSTSTGPAL